MNVPKMLRDSRVFSRISAVKGGTDAHDRTYWKESQRFASLSVMKIKA